MKKHKGLIIAGVVLAALAAIAAYCLWYTHVPRSWADVSGGGQINSLSCWIYHDTGPVEVEGTHPAAQAVISALEKRTYQAGLVNLSPIPLDPDHEPGVDSISLMMPTPKKRITVAIRSNGQFFTDIISSSPRCYSYQTDPELYQEVLDILLEYSTSE